MQYTVEQKAVILAEYDQRRANQERVKDIESDFKARGIPRTFQNWRTKSMKTPSTPGEPTMIEEPVEVLAGQMSIEDADTAPPEVHYGAVNIFDALPDGYAKVIQPMRPYTDAEEWALNKSMELYGFIGTIVYDQYGRILDGNQRQRVARLRGLGAPFTKVHVRDDAHAMEIARSLNAVRRQYTPEERHALALQMRDHGFSYRAIADALGVGKSTVYRDVFGVLRIRDDDPDEAALSHDGTNERPITDEPVSPETILGDTHEPKAALSHDGTIPAAEQRTLESIPEPVKRVQRKGGGTYPAQRPAGRKPTTSPADRQLAQVINLLMSHAQQRSDQHWQAFLEVVQNLRGRQAPAPATE